MQLEATSTQSCAKPQNDQLNCKNICKIDHKHFKTPNPLLDLPWFENIDVPWNTRNHITKFSNLSAVLIPEFIGHYNRTVRVIPIGQCAPSEQCMSSRPRTLEGFFFTFSKKNFQNILCFNWTPLSPVAITWLTKRAAEDELSTKNVNRA